MSSIDKRIVQMQFDNQGFEKGVSTTMKSLNSLNESLKMKGATNGLSEVNSSMNKLTSLGMGALSSGIEGVTSRFNAMGIIATTALMNITNRAIDAGRNFANALSIAPIMDGFSEYETKMNAIQTILTNTESKGTTLDDVIATLDELNTYADQTIYNFAEMTRNIGTFTAAGIDLETSATAIKGIANLAAGSGSSSAQASTAMYQLSQALAAGKVGLQDWNSVVNAGMGGELFQNALKDTAKQMGIYVNESKPFRETLQDNWLTSEVLIKTLESFADNESLLKAATEVKTFTQLIDTMKESVGSGWATSWEYIIGDKEQAAEFFTAISDGFNSIIQPSTDARNEMLKTWNENGGRAAVIEGLTNVVQGLGKALGAIGDAWKEVFPPMTGEKLIELSNKFKDLTENFKMSDKTAGKIKNTFKGVFDVVRLVGEGIISVLGALTPLTKIFDGFGTTILNTTSKIGGFFSGVKESAKEMGFFESISSGIKTGSEEIAGFLLGVKDATSTMIGYLTDLDFSSFFGAIGKGFKAIGGFLKPIMDSIADVIGTIDFGTIFDLVKAGSAVEIVRQLKNMFGEVSDVAESTKGVIGSFKGIGKGVKETLSTVKDTLEAYQKDLSASLLLKIAGSIAILAGSLLLISSIDKDKMVGGLMGLAIIFGELAAAYVLMSKFGSFKGMFKLGGFLISFATSVTILSSALKKLSEIEPERLMTGVFGLTSVMLVAVSTAKLMGKNTKSFIGSATSLIIFGSALHVMAGALEKIGSIEPEKLGTGLTALAMLLAELMFFMAGAKFGGLGITSATGILILSNALLVLKDAVEGFGSMDPDSIIRGLAGVAGILSEIALFSIASPGGIKMISLGVALNLIGHGLVTLSESLKSFGGIKWDEMGRGLTAMAGGLVVIGTASKLISGIKMTVVAVGISAMAGAMGLLGLTLKSFGGMSWEQIGKGMTVLAGSLTILAAAMYAMSGGILGAAALVVMAGAIAVLTPQLLLLSTMSIEGIGIALLGMAGAFTILGLAGLVLGPLVPILAGLAGVIALIGLGAAACGAGLMMIGAGLTSVGVAVGGSGLLIVEFLRQLLNLLPKFGSKMGEAIVKLAEAIGQGAPQIIGAVTAVISEILTSLGTLIPQFIQLAVDVVIAFAKGIETAVPELVTSGLNMLLGVLQGIADNIQPIVEAGADCVINFTNGMANKLPEVIDSGINLALSFIEGVADGLLNNQDRIATAIDKVIRAILTTGGSVLSAGIPDFVTKGGELLMGAINGIVEKWPDIKESVKGAIDSAKEGMVNAGTALWQAGRDMIQGFINGIASMATSVATKAKEVASGAVSTVKKFLGIHSPSRVFIEIGKFTAQGMSVGLNKYSRLAVNSAEGMASNVVDSVRNPLSTISKILDGDMDINPTITPVMDLSNISKGTRLLNSMIGNKDVQINARSGVIAGSVGKIQNRYDNSDVISALNGLKEQLNNTGPSYTINGITYDDGSSVSAAVQSLVRAARIERRL